METIDYSGKLTENYVFSVELVPFWLSLSFLNVQNIAIDV